MRVLLVDSAQLLDSAVVSAFSTRGHDLIATSSAVDALNLTQERGFDCIFIDIATSGDTLELPELRLLARRSAVALMTASPAEWLLAESLSKGNIEFRTVSEVVSCVEAGKQPVLLVAPDFQADLIKSLNDEGLRISSASTLQFAMNLMVDAWCHVVCLHADANFMPRPAICMKAVVGTVRVADSSAGSPTIPSRPIIITSILFPSDIVVTTEAIPVEIK